MQLKQSYERWNFKGDPKSKYKLAEIYAFEDVDSEFYISFLSFDL